ncbi:MAG: hypothetical protein ACE5JA_04850, partial [bacterium]
SRYIHRQAIDAGIVNDPVNYKWTSYRDYIGLNLESFVKPDVILRQFGRGNRARRSYEEFVLDDREGPVDWSGTRAPIIGDDDFVENLGLPKQRERRDRMSCEDLIEAVSRELEVDPQSLLNPRGKVQRRVRHQAFAILADRYEVSAAQLARAFGMCRSTVAKALKK